MEKTDWIDVDMKPLRSGVYETTAISERDPKYQYWNGKRWGLFASVPQRAYALRQVRSSFQDVWWRGLTSPNGGE